MKDQKKVTKIQIFMKFMIFLKTLALYFLFQAQVFFPPLVNLN